MLTIMSVKEEKQNSHQLFFFNTLKGNLKKINFQEIRNIFIFLKEGSIVFVHIFPKIIEVIMFFKIP